jgi:CheY-like chemotaxis protein
MAVVMAYCKSWGLDSEYQPTAASALHALHKTPDFFQAVVVDVSVDGESATDFLRHFGTADELAGVHALVLTEDEQTDQSVKKLGYSLQTLRKPFRKVHLREALRHCNLSLRRTGEIERAESQLRSAVASVGFSTNPLKSQNQRQEKAGAPVADTKILIVEDNPVNRRLVHLQLKTMGLDCDIVENGQEALDTLKKDHFDLIFMDCWMPVLDGFAATAEIRKLDKSKGRHTPIIAMTANAMDTDKDECLSAGMDDYMSKPVTRTILKSMLNKWLPKHQGLEFDTTDKSDEDSAPTTPNKLNTNTWG